jgi:hypothetical protein
MKKKGRIRSSHALGFFRYLYHGIVFKILKILGELLRISGGKRLKISGEKSKGILGKKLEDFC